MGTLSVQACRAQDAVFARKWLAAVARILNEIKMNSSYLAPRTASSLRVFVVQDVFQSLTNLPSIVNVDLAFDQLIKCLLEVSFGFLDELAFFSLDGKLDTLELLWRTRCITALMGCGLFEENERLSRVITSLFAWLSRQSFLGDTQQTMRKVGLLVASSVGALNDATKNQVVLLLLEAMLVHGHDVVALDLLALVLNNGGSPSVSIAALYVRGVESLPTLSDATLEHLWASVQRELPKNLGFFAQFTKTERLLRNRLVQILKSWADKGASESKLSLLQNMLCSCKSSDSSDKDTIAVMASKLSASY